MAERKSKRINWEITSLNRDDLDVEELERRLAMSFDGTNPTDKGGGGLGATANGISHWGDAGPYPDG